MPWTPTESLLGTHGELAEFSHDIQYYEEGAAGDPEAIPPVEAGPNINYTVKITPQEYNPDTVLFSTGETATISGYYKGIFNDSLTTRDSSGKFETVTTLTGAAGGVFDKVNRNNLHEVISFKADTTRSKTFTYLAEAYDELTPETIISSQLYTIKAEDRNWTPGMMNLKELVSYASSK